MSDHHTVRPIVVLDAPSNLGLRPPEPGKEPGVRGAPRALRAHRILERLGATDGGELPAPPYDPTWYPGYGVRNLDSIANYTAQLAGRVGQIVASGALALVLGGDCSILLGPALALRRRGRHGLIFLDGHLDFRHLGNSEFVGAAAGEDLALVTGRGDERLTDIDRLGPYLRDEDVVAVGECEGERGDIDTTAITALGLDEFRRQGVAQVLATIEAKLNDPELAGAWIHLDVDVLDNAVMPAVDSPHLDGMTYAEFQELLTPLLANPRVVGMDVTIYDPDLDPTREIARQFVDNLVAVLIRLSGGLTAAHHEVRHQPRQQHS